MNKIIYLDAAASYQKYPDVIDAERDFLTHQYANAGRGICARAVAVDAMVGRVRQKVADFINASPYQVVFTSGATDGLNRVVNLAQQMVRTGAARRVVAVSDLDHHSARLPWDNLVRNSNGEYSLYVMPLDVRHNIDVEKIEYCDLMVITAMSNVLGVAQDVAGIIRAARKKNPNVVTIVDASQYVVHLPVDVKKWDCDFMCFSGHKIGADTGVGIMYMRDADKLMPDKFGGGMVLRVNADGAIVPNSAPDKFEAGTLPLTQIAGLGVAIDCLKQRRPDTKLIKYMYDELSKNNRIKILSSRDATLLSFVIDGMHLVDFGALVGAQDLCMRVGNMCATWIHRALGIDGSARLSVGVWNTMDDAQRATEIINNVVK